ncbi:glycerophosphodiester phosphodiesterase [Sphingobacterium sp. SRCM116780]|uniref:glycerophosphodiester phosphodiesterase family protein n=1 Tax=Sphingobacterium sp. SRCM116780 TaxID=2907623 RepID=UPI001F382E7B|nr:glycerophosphodiester phosphodiesterase family protein [Sphingobacterium sp. SRCM116780]UIR56164.1 glycerophosphodiester phosphodiesterase [Sphingobacterium sp. SRCM116780]
MKKTVLVILAAIAVMGISELKAQTKIIAHRGAFKNTLVPENSIASLKASKDLNLWGSEYDVHLTKDDILVVNHDDDFYGIDIATSTYQELLAKKHPNGENIPTLEAYIKTGLKLKKLKLILELKTNKLGLARTLEAAEKTVALVKQLKAEKVTEYIAFSYDACKKIHELAPKAKIAYLNGDIAPDQIKKDGLTGIDYHLDVFVKNPTWLKEAQDLKLTTNVWTVNKETDMKSFIDQKIDYITTNEPELLKTLLKK